MSNIMLQMECTNWGAYYLYFNNSFYIQYIFVSKYNVLYMYYVQMCLFLGCFFFLDSIFLGDIQLPCMEPQVSQSSQ